MGFHHAVVTPAPTGAPANVSVLVPVCSITQKFAYEVMVAVGSTEELNVIDDKELHRLNIPPILVNAASVTPAWNAKVDNT